MPVYVRAGDRLLVTGGMNALSNGQTTGTDLAELRSRPLPAVQRFVAGNPGKNKVPDWAWADWPAFCEQNLGLLLK